MRIFTLEIKKIIKTRVTWILLLAALALSVLDGISADDF